MNKITEQRLQMNQARNASQSGRQPAAKLKSLNSVSKRTHRITLRRVEEKLMKVPDTDEPDSCDAKLEAIRRDSSAESLGNCMHGY